MLSRLRSEAKELLKWMFEKRIGKHRVVDIQAALIVGAAIPPQGFAIRALGEILGSDPLGAATSLLGGSIIFVPLTLFFHQKSQIARLRYKENRKWWFWVCGSPGAIFIIYYPAAIREVGLVAASLAAILGIVLFIFTGWSKLKGRWVRTIAGAICVLISTWLLGGDVRVETASDALYLLAATVFGFGVSLQFRMLQKVTEESSILAASAVSTVTGCPTALLVFVGLGLTGIAPLTPDNPWPTAVNDLWVYSCILCGVVIIPVGAYARKQLGAIYPIVMVSGNLISSVAISWIATVTFTTTHLVRVALAIAGVGLSTSNFKLKTLRPHAPRAAKH